jgi:hypothetical protein
MRHKAQHKDPHQAEFSFVSVTTWEAVPDISTGGLKLIPKTEKPQQELNTRAFAQFFLPKGEKAGKKDMKRVRDWIETGVIREEERRKGGPKQWLLLASAAIRLKEEWRKIGA